VLALLLVVLGAAAVSGPPSWAPAGGAPVVREEPAGVQPPTAPPAQEPQQQDEPDVIATILGFLVLAAVLALVVYGLIRLAHLLATIIRERRRADAAVQTDVETGSASSADDAVDAPVLQRGIAAALARVSAQGDPGDAIVAAWLGLEETAADAGSGRGRSETPAEFTLRILLRRPGIDAPARLLLRLYEQVRFGGRRGDEQMRRDAEAALSSIERGWR